MGLTESIVAAVVVLLVEMALRAVVSSKWPRLAAVVH